MANITTPIPNVVALKRSVQDHIDELPMWADGTKLPSVPMTGMQWLIWSLAAAGKFFEGYVVFMTGVAMPLFSREFEMHAFEHGMMGAASLFGILVGAVTLGGLSDRFGRKPMFVAEMIIFVAFLVALCFATNYIQVVIFLFGLGLALGCDYPTAHMIISENIPSSKRGKLVLGAFVFQAVGARAGTAVGFFVLSVLPELSAWRWMFASAIIPAVLVTLGRFSAAAVEICSWRRSQHFPKDLAARFIPQRYDSSPAGIGGSRSQGVARIDRERVPVDRDRVDVGRRAGRWIGKPPFVPGPGRRVPVGVNVLIDADLQDVVRPQGLPAVETDPGRHPPARPAVRVGRRRFTRFADRRDDPLPQTPVQLPAVSAAPPQVVSTSPMSGNRGRRRGIVTLGVDAALSKTGVKLRALSFSHRARVGA